jgi:hypothetical protein
MRSRMQQGCMQRVCVHGACLNRACHTFTACSNPTACLQDAAEAPTAMEEDSSTAQDDGKAAAAAGDLAARVSGLPEVELYLYLLLLIYLLDKQRHTQVRVCFELTAVCRLYRDVRRYRVCALISHANTCWTSSNTHRCAHADSECVTDVARHRSRLMQSQQQQWCLYCSSSVGLSGLKGHTEEPGRSTACLTCFAVHCLQSLVLLTSANHQAGAPHFSKPSAALHAHPTLCALPPHLCCPRPLRRVRSLTQQWAC